MKKMIKEKTLWICYLVAISGIILLNSCAGSRYRANMFYPDKKDSKMTDCRAYGHNDQPAKYQYKRR